MGRQPATPDLQALRQQLREEARVHLETRRELGPEYEDQIAESFVQRIEKLIDERIAARLEQRRLAQAWPRTPVNPVGVLAIAMALGIPLTAIAGAIAGATGIIAVWAGIIFLVLYFDLRR
jgi:hypothetical protein